MSNPVALFEAGHLDEATRLLETDPAHKKNYQAWLLLATCKQAREKYDEAGWAINMACALDPTSPAINYFYIQHLLARGQIKTGINLWRQYLIMLKACPLSNPKNIWDGVSDLNNKTMAVAMNYKWGQGDQIHFGRYIKLLKMKYPRVKICLFGSNSLKRLFLENQVADAFFDPADESSAPTEGFTLDYYADLLLLGAFLAKDYQRQEPFVYLKAGEAVSDELKAAVQNQPRGQAKVAFVYNGAARAYAKRRDINNIEDLKTIFLQNPQIQFYCLQKEAGDADFAGLDNVTTLGPLLSDFYDTAFVLEQMDAVVTVETAAAALASAMGKEVHLISRVDYCWRFHTYQGRSLWFDNLISYRHEGKPQWPVIFDQIGHNLRERFPASEVYEFPLPSDQSLPFDSLEART